MKILELDLRAFGPFTGTRLDLSGGRHGLHLIFGPNEAGKSSALRALRQLLFGIDPRTSDRFLHDYDKLRLGGVLRRDDGEELAFVRRKGTRKVLLSPDESTVLDDEALAPFLVGIDPDRFETLFSLDHDRLLNGGKKVLEGQGDAGILLFGAGTDLGGLLKLRKKLEADALALFRPRGENYPLNRSLSKYQEANRAIADSLIRSEAWVEHQRLMTEAQTRAEELGAELVTNRDRVARLERIRQALPDVALRDELVADLDHLKATPRLPEHFADDRRAAEELHRDAQRIIREAHQERERLQGELEAIPAPGSVLAEAERIESIKARHEALRNQVAEIAALRNEREFLETSTLALRAKLGLDSPDDATEAPRITIQQHERVRMLGNDWHAVIHDCESLGKSLDRLTQELRERTEAIEALEAPRDTAPLRRFLKRVEREGDPSRDLEESRRKATQLERRALADLKKLAPWSGTLGDLEALTVPGVETLDAHDDALQEAEGELAEAQRRLREAEEKSRAIASEIAANRLGRDVPTEEELRAARARRDLYWKVIKAEWRGLEQDIEALRAFPSYASGDPSAAFERSLIEADTLADRLRLEADRVATLARLEAERIQAERTLTSLLAERETAIADRSEAESRWLALWSPLGIEPGAPREMRSWIQDHARLVEKVAAIHEERAQQAEHERRAQSLRAEISRLLGELGEPLDGRDVPLSDLLERAKETRERLDELKNQRRSLDEQREKTERQLDSTRRDEAEARQKLAEWRDAWALAVVPLGIDPAAKPVEVNATLEKREELAADLRKLDGHHRRIEAFERDGQHLETEARALAGRVAPEFAAEPLAKIVEGLGRLLTEAHRSEARRQNLQGSLETWEERDRVGRRQANAARDRLDDFLRIAGCSEDSQLPEVEDQDRRRRDAEDRLREVDDRLRNHGGGTPIAAFLDEVRGLDPKGLPETIATLNDRIQEWDTEHKGLIGRIAEERQTLQNMEEFAREARATQAANEAQELLARIEAEASRYARLKLAMAVLRQAIENYRQRSQGPVLRLASTLFQRLTLGSFNGLTTEYDDEGSPRLLGQRPSGATVGVEGMSEGTRDQLYLALKLASLEHHLDHHEPLPFIADDLLVNHDDERARAALRILAELSQRTQVLFFTHHRHLAELAEATLKPDVLWTHELPGTTLIGRPAAPRKTG